MPTATVLPTLAPEQRATPDEVKRYQALAEALLAQSQGGEPVKHWTQGVANMVEALMGGLSARKANQMQREGEARGWEYLQNMPGLYGGGGGGYTAPSGGGETAETPNMEAMSGTGDDADMIIRTVIGEAAGEDPVGQQAVASVIMNRAKQSGMTPSQVVLAKGQFEPWGSRAGQLRAIDPSSEQYQRVAANVLPILQGQAPDPTGGATHFYAPRAQAALGRSTPSWARGPGQDIGNHRFYSLGYGGGGRHGIPGETADIPGAKPVGSEPSPDVAQFLGQPPAPPQASTAARQALIAKALGAPREAPADVAADVRKYYANEPPSPPPPRPPVRPPGEIADIPGAEPMSSAPSPEVMRHITGGGATPAGMGFTALPGPAAIRKPVQPPAMAPPPPPPISPAATRPPVQPPAMAPPPPPLAARVPQPRPAPPVAPAAPATTGTVAPMAPARPVPMPPVKNDYAQFPGRRPSVAPVRPGQLMNEPYPGVMSAQEFARAGQAAMRARAAGQQPGLAPAAGQPQQPRRGLLQALLGRGGTPGASGAPTAPTGAPAAPGRAGIAAAMQDISFLPPAVQGAVLKRMFETGGEGFTLGKDQVRFDASGRPIAQGPPGDPEKREIRLDANKIPRYVDTGDVVFSSDQGAVTGEGFLSGTSVEAQSLNYLIQQGRLTKEQAAEVGAGKVITGPNNEIIFMTPSGLVVQPAGAEGTPAATGDAAGGKVITGPRMTEDQRKTAGFHNRMNASDTIISKLEQAALSSGEQAASNIPLVGNYLVSSKFRQFDQAQRDFINAQLRRESGAVISDSEFENARKQYLPVPGDDPKTLRQKAEARKRAVADMQASSAAVPTFAGQPAESAPETAPEVEVDENGVPVGYDPEEWKYLTPDEQEAYIRGG